MKTKSPATRGGVPGNGAKAPFSTRGRLHICRPAFVAASFFATAVLAQDKVKLNLRVLDAETGKPVAGFRALTFEPPLISGFRMSGPGVEWTGNDEGQAVVEFQAAGAAGYQRGLQILHPAYVSFEKMWWHFPKSSAAPSGTFPEEFTAKLDPGVAIGGVVKDETGKPLSEVRVYPVRHSYARGPEASLDSWPAWPLSYTADAASNAVHAVSDAAGRWKLERFPRNFENVAFAVVRPDQSMVMIATAVDQFVPLSRPMIPLARFLEGSGEIVLPRGQTIRGSIVGTDGEPLAGVALSETYGRNPGIVARTVADANGRFALSHRPEIEIVLVAQFPGRALVATNVLVEPGLPELRLVLRPQQGIAAKVVDGNGAPLAGARVALDQYDRPSPLEWGGTQTDAEGRFRWDAGPFEPTDLYILPANGPVRAVTLRASEPERTIVIRSEQAEFIRLKGTVVSAETKEPIKRFTVASSGSDTYAFNFKADGRDGTLDVTLPLKAWRENFLPVGELQVIADGFASQSIGQVNFREGDREFHVMLKRGAGGLQGVVLQPDGQPADGARMEMTRGGYTFLNRPGEFQPPGRDSERFTTGADGKYSFADDQRNRSLVVAHSSGFAGSWASNLAGAASIRLQPWARIRGVAMESGKPLANQNVSLRSPSAAIQFEIFGVSYSTTTDSDGQFGFERVPAGSYVLSRRLPLPPLRGGPGPIQFTHAQAVTVAAGEDKEIVYGGKGRTVMGMAQSDPPDLAVNWQWDTQFLVPIAQTNWSFSKPRQPNYLDYASQETYTAALRRFQSAGREDPIAAEMRYQVQFDSDGRFHVTDVPPGKYELAIHLTDTQSSPQPFMFSRSGKPIGSARQTLTIPDGALDEPVNVGTIRVAITSSLPRAKPLPPFEALTLDGGTWRATELRGKHVALVFWAGWCRASAEAMPELEQIYSAYHTNPRFAMIGVSLDESAEVARGHAKRLGINWATAWLDEPGRLRLMETYGVTGLPTVFLLDPSSKIAARDLKPASLRAALKRALGTN